MDIQSSLLEVVQGLKEDLAESLKTNGRYASGRTEEQIIPSATDHSAQLDAPGWIYALQDGRKPTSEGATAGSPTLFEAIKEWCAYKGIDQKLAYPITKKIHEEGYAGTPGIIDEPLSDENIDKHLNKALGDIATLFTNDVSKAIDEKLVLV